MKVAIFKIKIYFPSIGFLLYFNESMQLGRKELDWHRYVLLTNFNRDGCWQMDQR